MKMIRALILIGVVGLCGATARGTDAQDAATWDVVLELPSGDVQAITIASPNVAWAAGGGALWWSGDAGRHWEVGGASEWYMHDIEAMPDGLRGWAAGTSGALYATADGGRSWEPVELGTEIHLADVEALSDQTILVSGYGVGFSDVIVEPMPALFRRSTDGGRTWSEISLGGYRVNDLAALADGEHAWAAGQRCIRHPEGFGCASVEFAVFSTDDGGVTWRAMAQAHRFLEMHFASIDAGWAVEYACQGPLAYDECRTGIARTEDGGATWTGVLDLGSSASAQVWGFDAATAVAAVSECREQCTTVLRRTSDGGETWSDGGAPTSGVVTDIAYATLRSGLRVQQSRVEWTDDGSAWHEAVFPVTAGPGDFDFIDARRGWFAASRLLRTEDGGDTFAPVGEGTPPDTIDFVSPSEGWGTDLVCEPACTNTVHILHTVDSGHSWQIQRTLSLGNYLQLEMFSPGDGWAFSLSDRLLLRTTDGATWEDRQLPTVAPALEHTSLAFTPGGIAWFVERSCSAGYVDCRTSAWRTTDGGLTWAVASPLPLTTGCPVSVHASDARHAVVIGYECTDLMRPLMFRTADGGNTWQRVSLSGTGFVLGLTFFDRNRARGVRALCPDPIEHGAACDTVYMRTADGGVTWDYERIADDTVPGRFQIVEPELAYFAGDLGGGAFLSAGQRLYRYGGAVQGRPPVVPPDAGSGAASEERSLQVAMLAAAVSAGTLGSLLVGGMAWRSRRR